MIELLLYWDGHLLETRKVGRYMQLTG